MSRYSPQLADIGHCSGLWQGQTCSVSEALSKTFDGKHPYRLCKQIAAAKKSEKKA